MKKKRFKRDFDYWIDEYMYNCRSRKLRPKTMSSYEQTLRLFDRWCQEEANITEPEQVLETTRVSNFAGHPNKKKQILSNNFLSGYECCAK